MGVVFESVLLGVVVLLAGTLPRNLLFFANLQFQPSVPWAAPLIALYLWLFWRYLRGAGPPPTTAATRRERLRANSIPAKMWLRSLVAGGLGIVALVLGLRVINRLIVLPHQQVPDLVGVTPTTMATLLAVAAPVAGVVEEAAFRGYMQGPIEKRHGLAIAILVTGTMFAVAHLDFTLILWPYYVAVAAIYGIVTHLTNSILPAIVLHTAGNLYSNFTLWLTGRAEWQTSGGPSDLIWTTGLDAHFWIATIAFVVTVATTVCAYAWLANCRAQQSPVDGSA